MVILDFIGGFIFLYYFFYFLAILSFQTRSAGSEELAVLRRQTPWWKLAATDRQKYPARIFGVVMASGLCLLYLVTG